MIMAGSEDEDDDESSTSQTDLEKDMRKVKQKARENSNLIDADDSDELRSICPSSDDEINLWSGTEDDDDDDIPTEPHPNEKSDAYIDKVFDFNEIPKYRTISEMLKAEEEPPELSPGKQV
jgi:hypothetical protein